MAVLTPLSLDEVRAIGKLFALEVEGIRPIPEGSVNSNFALALPGGGRAFLRVYEEQTASSARGEAALLEHLAAQGVPTPKPLLRTDGAGFIAAHGEKPVALFPWIDGEMLCQKRVTAEAARRVGEAVGRTHRAGSSFEGGQTSRFGVRDLEARLERVLAMDLTSEVRADAERLAAVLSDLAKRPRTIDGMIHGDLFRDNVLWKGGEIAALLDFESASLGSFPFDVAVTMLAWCTADHLEPELCAAMFAGYRGVREIPAEERDRLFEEARFAATRFGITRITDYELRPRGNGVYKDYRRFIGRLDALEKMGPSGFAMLLGR